MSMRTAWKLPIFGPLRLSSLRFSSSSYPSPGDSPNASLESQFSSLPALQQSDDAELVSSILIHHHNPFHAMESSLQLNGISLSPSLVHQTLLRLRNVSKIALAFFTWTKSIPDYQHDSISYNILIDVFAKVRQFDAAWQLIIEMDQCLIGATSITFRILVRRLISAALTRQAIRAFDDMESFVQGGAKEEDFLYLVDTLCKYGYVKLAVEVFNQRRSRFQPNVKMYTVLIYGWCKIGRVDMAERFLRDMAERGVEPNVVTYNVLLNGICRRASLHPDERFERTVRAADRVFKEMRRRGIEPDVGSYSVVLHVYSRAHKPQLSLDKLNEMKSKGISPTVVTYTSVIKCLCSCGRLEDAEDLLSQMVSSGISPCSETYNCFFKEYRGRKDADSALKLYKKMRENSFCMPSMHTYNILIVMFAKLDRMQVVQEIWDDMKASGLGPDLDSYTLLIHEFCEKQKWREACQYFIEMIEKGYLPQKVTFETLYRGLIQSDKLRTWRRLKKKLDEESITYGLEFEPYHLKPYRR